MLRTVFVHELRLLLRDRSVAIVGMVLLLSVVGGLLVGRADVAERQGMEAEAVAQEDRTFSAFRDAAQPTAELQTGSSGFDASTNPGILSMFYPRPATLPPAPLAALSVGQSDVYPSLYLVTGERKDSFLDAVELTNPLHALAGAFDMAFVVVFMLPLFLLVLSHDLLSRERETGTLAQVLAQPVSLGTVIAGKLLARSVAIWAVIAMTGVGLLAMGEMATGDAWARLGLWSLAVLAYGAVWLGLAALVDAWIGRAVTNAVVVSAIWLFLALIGPALLQIGVSKLAPVPSRSELIVATREVETSSRQPVEFLHAYYQEHPDRYPTHPEFDINVYDFPLYWAAIQREVDFRLGPAVNRYDRALDAQEQLARTLRPLMPVALAVETFNDLSGSGLRRYRSFTDQILRFHDAHRAFYEPLIFSKTPLSREDYDRMPRFRFVEESVGEVARGVLGGLAALAAIAVLAIGGAAVGYRSRGRPIS